MPRCDSCPMGSVDICSRDLCAVSNRSDDLFRAKNVHPSIFPFHSENNDAEARHYIAGKLCLLFIVYLCCASLWKAHSNSRSSRFSRDPGEPLEVILAITCFFAYQCAIPLSVNLGGLNLVTPIQLRRMAMLSTKPSFPSHDQGVVRRIICCHYVGAGSITFSVRASTAAFQRVI
jgi:hypothetical protein